MRILIETEERRIQLNAPADDPEYALRVLFRACDFFRPMEPPKATAQRPYNSQPRKGDRVIDYALKVAPNLPPKWKINLMAQRMVELGWQTTSPRLEKTYQTIYGALKRHASFRVDAQDHTWTYVADAAREEAA